MDDSLGFDFFEALNDNIEAYFFSQVHFYIQSDIMITSKDMRLTFLKLDTMLTNAFKRCRQANLAHALQDEIINYECRSLC